jgi:hypothetical protein
MKSFGDRPFAKATNSLSFAGFDLFSQLDSIDNMLRTTEDTLNDGVQSKQNQLP